MYADGRVIASATDATGFFCAAVPTFRMGRSDVAALRALVEKYLRSKESAVDLSDNPNVADGVLTRLEYLGYRRNPAGPSPWTRCTKPRSCPTVSGWLGSPFVTSSTASPLRPGQIAGRGCPGG